MGESKQTTSSQQMTGPWLPSQNLLRDILNRADNQFARAPINQAERDALRGLRGNIRYSNEYLPQMQGLVGDLFNGGGYGEGRDAIRGTWDTTNAALTPIARGDFVNPESNPYIQGILSKTQSDLKNSIGGMFAGGGRSFSGAHMKALGTGIGDATNNLLFNAYNSERDRQANAIRDLNTSALASSTGLDAIISNILGARSQGAQLAPTVTGMRDDPYLKTLELEKMRRSMPLQNLGMLRDLILPIAGLGSVGHSESSTTQAANPVQTAIGATIGGLGLLGGGGFGGLGSLFGSSGGLSGLMGMAGAGGGGGAAGLSSLLPLFMFSDRRIKDDIEEVGRLHNGLPVYSFRYRGSPTTQIGLMAQDVEKQDPDAVIEVGGVKMVNYKKATEMAGGIHEWRS